MCLSTLICTRGTVSSCIATSHPYTVFDPNMFRTSDSYPYGSFDMICTIRTCFATSDLLPLVIHTLRIVPTYLPTTDPYPTYRTDIDSSDV